LLLPLPSSAQDRERIRRIEAEETKAFLKWRDILLDLGARRRLATDALAAQKAGNVTALDPTRRRR